MEVTNPKVKGIIIQTHISIAVLKYSQIWIKISKQEKIKTELLSMEKQFPVIYPFIKRDENEFENGMLFIISTFNI